MQGKAKQIHYEKAGKEQSPVLLDQQSKENEGLDIVVNKETPDKLKYKDKIEVQNIVETWNKAGNVKPGVVMVKAQAEPKEKESMENGRQ